MLRVRPATEADIPTIRSLALAIWPVAYGNILSEEQLAYMLDLMYSEAALERQMTSEQHLFLLALEEDRAIGFTSCSTDRPDQGSTRLHKLYVLPALQGSGAGKLLLSAVCERAREAGNSAVNLNVNRHNPAVRFYRHHGFSIVRDEVLDIGNGFVMDDHVMERRME